MKAMDGALHTFVRKAIPNLGSIHGKTMVKVSDWLIEEWRGHGGRVVTLSPPTSAAGVRSPSWP